jgi:glycosyltransferase involved in cell wall biosynthesis
VTDGRLSVLLTTEGTYPHSPGGVSTWCETLIRNTPEVSYVLLPIMMNPHIEQRYQLPKNVRRTIETPLWGIEEPAEFLRDIRFARLHAKKRLTGDDEIEREFVPVFTQFLRVVGERGKDAAGFGRLLLEMQDYFARRDYNDTFKSRPVWQAFRRFAEQQAASGTDAHRSERAPSLFDLTECLRWLYRFLIVLNVRVPRTDLAHTTAAAFCGIPAILAKLRYGTPMLLTEHGVYLREQNLFLSTFRRLVFSKHFLLNLITSVARANYHFADIVAPVCFYNTRWEVEHGVRREKIRVIYNGVDPDVFKPAEKRSSRMHVVATARIDPLKGIDTFLHMAAKVREVMPDVAFTIHGAVADEAYFQTCLDLRRSLGLDDVVSMGSATEDVVSAYNDADVVVLTSVSEAFPYSVLEAMSCGKAVVATDVGGVREALEGNGILIAPRDADAAATAVLDLLRNSQERERLGVKARKKVIDSFRIDHTTARYLALYQSMRESAA